MSRIAIIGGHGKVALRLARLLTDQGHVVTSLFRNPDHTADVRETGATPVVLDVEHATTAEIAESIRGHDALVWSAGAGGGDPARTRAVDLDAAVRSMEAAAEAGVQRYIMVSYLGSDPDHGIPEGDPFHAYADAKSRADEQLRTTSLDWTILGPGRLTLNDPTGRIRTLDDPADAGSDTATSRDNVALVAAAALEEDGSIRTTIDFVDGETPIEEAVRRGRGRR